MDFDTFLDQAWTDHATDAPTVAARIAEQGLGHVSSAEQVVPLAHLSQHVFGDHLGRWQSGLDFLDRLRALPVVAEDAVPVIGRFQSALRLAGALADERPSASADASGHIRITALAASQVAAHDAVRGAALLEEAVAAADAAALPDADPAHRNLAIAGNGIAGTLEEKAGRSADETALMLRAAAVARRFWALAGTWLETERADYRLALSHLQAGQLAQARRHAQYCLERVQANGNVPLEAFFGWEALARVERAAANSTGHAQAQVQAAAWFERLEAGDQGWCKPSLEALG